MNNQRRKQIAEAAEALAEAYAAVQAVRELIEAIRDEEQEVFEAMPESLQQGERGQLIEEAASNLEEAVNALDAWDLEEVVGLLDSAAA